MLAMPSGGGAALAELALENATCWLPDGLKLTPLRQSFHAAMRPEEYLAPTEQLWDALHDMLAP